MNWHRGRPITAITLLLTTYDVSSPLFAQAPGAGARDHGPAHLSEVFDANRAAVLRVRAHGDKVQWDTGFLIGAQGEFVFGLGAKNGTRPERLLAVEFESGRSIEAELIGFDLGLALGIGRITDPKFVSTPLRFAKEGKLEPRTWVLAIRHDKHGKLEPFAGLVDAAAKKDMTRKTPIDVLIAPVSVPADPGSPILSTRGELVGIALTRGDRKTHVVPIEIVVPFLKQVVLGNPAH